MANDPSRTEKATPKRRQKAREEGSVLRVPDLDSTVILWGNLFLFSGLWASTLALLAQQVAFFLAKTAEPTYISDGNLHHLAMNLASIILKILLPFLALNFMLSLANQFLQHGFKPNFKPLTPKLDRLNPAGGFKRLFSPRSFVEIAKSLFKFLIVASVAYSVLKPRLPIILTTYALPLNQSLSILQESLFVLYRNIMIAMLVLAGADFLYQRHSFEKNLRMTKQEVKDETKDSEGSPEIKGKQRSLMFSSLLRRIMTQVPQASVVITNPTHYAVALRYDQKTATPICVAKGVDHLAMKIRERAKAFGVPIVENPPLARSIYHGVGLEQPIPPSLYQAVAQILAYVYRLRGVA